MTMMTDDNDCGGRRVIMLITFTMTIIMMILMFSLVRVARPMMTSYLSFPGCRERRV